MGKNSPDHLSPNSTNESSQSNLSHTQVKPARKTSIVDMLSTPPVLASESESVSSLSRHPSISSSVMSGDNSVSGHQVQDWQNIPLMELVEENKLIFVQGDVSIEEAFTTLTKHNLTSLPVEEFESDINCTTFDYGDLNTYLLLVLHKIDFNIEELEMDPHFTLRKSPLELLNDIKSGKQVPVKFVCQLTSKNPFIKLNEKLDTLSTVCEILGSGVHRVAIVNNENRITGILSQRRMMRYLWDNARKFRSLDTALQTPIDEIGIGSTDNLMFVYGDQPLIDALIMMHDYQMSSVAVVDRSQTLLGNISITDVKHVSSSSKSILLHKSCLHFVSVILNSRGLEDGQDSFPIFHVFPNSTLGRVIAKLVATKAHRLWIVRPKTTSSFSSPSKPNFNQESELVVSPLLKPEMSGRAGKLVGVVSLTDILGFLAQKNGSKIIDPHAARKQRRRSSSSASSRSAKSLEQLRGASKDGR